MAYFSRKKIVLAIFLTIFKTASLAHGNSRDFDGLAKVKFLLSLDENGEKLSPNITAIMKARENLNRISLEGTLMFMKRPGVSEAQLSRAFMVDKGEYFELFVDGHYVQPGDQIEYSLFAVHEDDIGYFLYAKHTFADQDFPGPSCSITELYPTPLKKPCAGEVIFRDDFRIFDSKKWLKEKRLVTNPKGPFQFYHPDAVEIVNGSLMIKPTRTKSTGTIDLRKQCTATRRTHCFASSDQPQFLPEVMSGRIVTRGRFGFKHAKIVIRAKVPRGDWIYPELYLLPRSDRGDDRVALRIAFFASNEVAEINKVLKTDIHDFDCRPEIGHTAQTPWTGDFHEYELRWSQNSIQTFVDGKKMKDGGIVTLLNEGCDRDSRWKSTAPFDDEFYIAIGVGVGGHSEFADSAAKTWRNGDVDALSEFNKDIARTVATWREDSSLIVDYVEVRAI